MKILITFEERKGVRCIINRKSIKNSKVQPCFNGVVKHE